MYTHGVWTVTVLMLVVVGWTPVWGVVRAGYKYTIYTDSNYYYNNKLNLG